MFGKPGFLAATDINWQKEEVKPGEPHDQQCYADWQKDPQFHIFICNRIPVQKMTSTGSPTAMDIQ